MNLLEWERREVTTLTLLLPEPQRSFVTGGAHIGILFSFDFTATNAFDLKLIPKIYYHVQF